MNKTPAKQPGGKWAPDAFPGEAAMNFDEFDPNMVRAVKAEVEMEVDGDTWEVVDGLKFPYDSAA